MTAALQATVYRSGWAASPAAGHAAGKRQVKGTRAAALAGIVAILVLAQPLLVPGRSEMVMPQSGGTDSPGARRQSSDAAKTSELLIAGYIGQPAYYRSNVHLTRPDGTDLLLKGLGWDGDALRFPIDGGVRAIRWGDKFGVMIDFLHNKAIARLGRGAHGRKRRYAVVEEVEASGTIKGRPAPSRIKLTDIFNRLEFTHGHNMLFFTGMMRFANLTPTLRPYAGLGAGFAIPHTEVRIAGEKKSQRTSEYQYGGPAAQALFGIEFQSGRMSYFIEYKFSYAWIRGALSGDESWLNFNMPGDLWRQFKRWWRSEQPKYGSFTTTLGAHQINVGAGYRWHSAAP